MNDDDNERRLPPPIPPKLIPNKVVRNGWRQESPPKAPLRAIRIKGDALRAVIRNGNPLDWTDIHERYVDLWQEARLVIWRAKHSKAGLQQTDPITGQTVATFAVDERLVLQALDTTRAILDSLVKLRRQMGPDTTGIPRWAVEKIERALRDYPEAQHALLKALAAEDEKLPN